MRHGTRRNVRFLRGFIAILLLSLFAVTASSQALKTGVNGTVEDSQGAVVSGATVSLTDIATNTTRTTTTNERGFFAFTDVREGIHSVTVEATGFKKTTVTAVEVNIDQTSSVAVTLEVGDVAEVVVVSASDAQIIVNTENAELKNTVLKRQIEDLPLNGRNPLDLAGLQAGVNSSSSGNRNASINGLRGTFSNLTWDGININDNFVRTASLFGIAGQSVASVSEFTLTTQNSGSGDGLGVAQIKLVTPRGSSEFHGSVYDYHRNDVLDANTFFNNRTIDSTTGKALAKPKLIRNEFGGNIGGPITIPNIGNGGPTWLHDKLFFYAYYEGTRTRSDASFNRSVLSSNARQGLFTYQRTDNGQQQTVNLLNYTNLPIDAAMANLIGLTPLPNNADSGDGDNTGGFRFNTGSGSDGDLWGFRFDFHLDDKNRFEAIYSRFEFVLPNDTFNNIGEVFPGLPGGGQASIRPRGSFAWIWNPGSSFSNSLRYGFNDYDVEFTNNEPFANGRILAFPITNSPIQTFQPQGRDVFVDELIDNASYTMGDHFIQFGANVRWLKVLPFNDAGRIPVYQIDFGVGNPNPLNSADPNQFPGGIGSTDFSTATSILELLTGVVDSASQTFNVVDRTGGFVSGAGENRDLRNYSIGVFGNDSWRIFPNLTFTIGLRYEFISVPKEQNGLALLPVGGIAGLSNPNAVLDFAGTSDRPFFNTDWNNFAPTIAFAWDPFNDGRTSIRGGYGISYVIDNTITMVRNAFRANDGLRAGRTITGLSGTVSTGGIVPVPQPPYQVPRTAADNAALDPGNGLFTIDPNYKTPYVQQWNIGISREIFKDTALEVRYVGNRGTQLSRATDLNQMRIRDNGFLEDFRRAEFNFANCGGVLNPTAAQCPNRQPLTLLPRLGLGGFLTSGTVRGYVSRGEAGRAAGFYYFNRAFFLNGAFGGDPSLTNALFARTNTNSMFVDVVGNGSYSIYHGLQAEVRKRLSQGLYFQANYTFSKGFADFEGSQSNFQAFMDIETGAQVEKRRIANDNTHVFKANAIYELPFGPGKRFLNFNNGAADRFFGGWSIGGLFRWQTGEPISFVSQRGTVNRTGSRSNVNSAVTSLSNSELQSNTGVFFDPNTGQPNMFPANFVNNFSNPRSGTLGTLGLTPVSGPSMLFFDASVIKRTSITERINFEFRVEAFNVMNTTTFNVLRTQNINSSGFGRITSAFPNRIIQLAAKVNF